MTDQQPTSNTPLFQNMDEQEAVYAPQQVSGTGTDAGGSTDTTTDAAGAVAVTNAGLVGNPGGVTSASGPGVSGVGAVAPVVPLSDDDRRTTSR
jgi:hypothetical protein